MIDKRYSLTTRPANGAMNLEGGKPDAKQAFLTAGFTFAALLVAAVGGLTTVWSTPGMYGEWTATRWIGVATGLLIVLFGFRFAWSMGNLTIGLWQGYHRRLEDWHDAELEMYLAQNGVETVQEVSYTELQPQVAMHVLMTALAIQYRLSRASASVRYSHAPWSVRGLEEKIYLDGGSNAVLLGEITGTRPELMSERLAQLGLITGRKPGVAGDWSAQSFDDVFDKFSRNWSKLR